jgi:hypothetical protein
MTLRTQLAALENSGLISLIQSQPEVEYLFRHALIQDAAYVSLLKADRKQLHQLIGETLEHLSRERLDEIAPLLADHFDKGEDTARALKYYTLAGDAAGRVYANTEASQHYTRAIEIAQHNLTTLQPAQLEHLYLQRGRTLELNARYDEVLQNYEDFEAVGLKLQDRKLQLAALMEMTKMRALPSSNYDPSLGRRLAERSLALAREIGDQAAEARLLWLLMLLMIYSGGGMPEALEFGEQSLALARVLNLREQMAFILNDIWYVYLGTDQLPKGLEVLTEVSEMWREMGNIPMLASSLGNISQAHTWLGHFDEGIVYSDRAAELCRSINNIEGEASSRFVISVAYAESGHVAEAIRITKEALKLSEQTGLLAALGGTRAQLGWAYAQVGAVEEGVKLARIAFQFIEGKIPLLQPWSASILARLYLLQDKISAAQALLEDIPDYHQIKRQLGNVPMVWINVGLARVELAIAQHDFERALTLANVFESDLRANHCRAFINEILYLKAQILITSEHEDAYSVLQQASAEAEQLNARIRWWRILLALSELEMKRGNASEAARLRAQARGIVQYIAAHTPPDLRETFLQIPEVLYVMERA